MRSVIIFLCLIGLGSCEFNIEKALKDEVIIIPKGKHNAEYTFRPFSGQSLRFEARFNETSKYATVNPQNQTDINKLLGFSDCNSQHHENSARFGWRWYNNNLEVFSYIYENEHRKFSYLTSVPLNKYVQFEIRKTPEGYLFIVGENTPVLVEREACDGNTNYVLWPYFGGTEAAPHDIQIEIVFSN